MVATAAVSGDPVEIPVILPLTGGGAQIGQADQQGFQVLEKFVNDAGGIKGRPVKFTFFDDQTTPQVSVQLFNQAAARGAQVVLGGGISAMCKATMPLAVAKGPVLYCLSPAVRPARDGYTFSGNIHPVDLSAAAFRFFSKRGWKKIALLLSTDASGQEVDSNMDALMARPEMRGLEIVAREHFAPGDVSVNAQVSKIEAAHPQAILIWAGTGIPVALHSLSDSGNKLPVATSNSLMLYSSMAQFASILPNQLYFPAPKWAAYPAIGAGPVKDMLDQYFRAFKAAGIQPDQGQNIAWDPGLIVVNALRKLGPDAKAAQIRDEIASVHNFAGANGFYDFRTGDQRGLNPNDTIVTQWVPAKKTWVLVK